MCTHFDASAADTTFENIVMKGNIARDEQFLTPATMFSTVFNNYKTFVYRDLPHFGQDVFKVIYHRFVVCDEV